MCLGEHAELQRQESADGHTFQQGDKVKCLLDVDILRQMQEGHGGWNPKMAEVNECNMRCLNVLLLASPSYKKLDIDCCLGI